MTEKGNNISLYTTKSSDLLPMYNGLPYSPETTLTQDISASATEVMVENASDDILPPGPNWVVLTDNIEAETIEYQAKDGNRLVGVMRGIEQNGVGMDWAAGTIVANYMVEKRFRNMGVNINNINQLIKELTDFTQRKDIFVTPEQKTAWDLMIQVANDALALAKEGAGKLTNHEARILQLEDALFNKIHTNPFLVTFDNLDGVTVAKGIHNPVYHRIEC